MGAEGEQWPAVSVIMPVRNERESINGSLGAVLTQHYPGVMQVIVADGMSDDGTHEIIRGLQRSHSNLLLVENSGKIVSAGLNLALEIASGEVIVRVDGHTVIAPDYVFQCVRALKRTGADCVGGRMTSWSPQKIGMAVAFATGCPFGVGNARFHYSQKEEWVDTVYLGAWWRNVFDRIGPFHPEMKRNQDDEFSYRLLAHGGKILLSPDIKSVYTPRSTFTSLARQYFMYGEWKVRVMVEHLRQMRMRQFAPPTFVVTMSFLGSSAAFSNLMLSGLVFTVGVYIAAGLYFALHMARGHGMAMVLRVFSVFPVLHFSYGAGFLKGLAAIIPVLWRRRRSEQVRKDDILANVRIRRVQSRSAGL